ncbi:unnamed protein product [Ectocarpus sp. 6 AP-2014]
MTPQIPVALDTTGENVLPADAKQGPFKCIECAMPLVLVEGGCHFAHESDFCGCFPGETLKIVAAQLVIAKYLARIKLIQTCHEGHRTERQYEGHTASLDFRFKGHSPGDVAVIKDGEMDAIIEVKGETCVSKDEDYSYRRFLVSPQNWYEVDANTVFAAQSSLRDTEGSVEVDATNHRSCKPCHTHWVNFEYPSLRREIFLAGFYRPPPPQPDKRVLAATKIQSVARACRGKGHADMLRALPDNLFHPEFGAVRKRKLAIDDSRFM